MSDLWIVATLLAAFFASYRLERWWLVRRARREVKEAFDRAARVIDRPVTYYRDDGTLFSPDKGELP